MASEEIRQRADLLGTLVVTRDTGKKLGVVSQLWVDIDQREVVALSLRPNLLYGTPQPMLLDSICQIGDVILVDNEDVIEDIDVEVSYTSLINYEVITESGNLIGKVRGFKFDIDSGAVSTIIVASLGVPLIPDQVVSTYEFSIDEVVSFGPERLILFEGSEERLVQLSVGVLERLGLGRAPWEADEEDIYKPPVARPENMLGTGLRTPMTTPLRQKAPVIQETWDEDNWGEPEPRQLRQERRAELYYSDDDGGNNWSEASGKDRYDRQPYQADDYTDDYDGAYDDEYEEDAWAERPNAIPYESPKVDLRQTARQPEYEE